MLDFVGNDFDKEKYRVKHRKTQFSKEVYFIYSMKFLILGKQFDQFKTKKINL